MTKTFCVLPWIHLATHPHGGVSLCCEADHTDNMSHAYDGTPDKKYLKNLADDSIEDIMNSDSFKMVRVQMLNGRIPDACKPCFLKEEQGIESKRIRENANFPDFTVQDADRITRPLGGISSNRWGHLNEINLEFIELRLGNLCNLKCRSCNPASSSALRPEFKTIENELDFINRYSGLDHNLFKWPEQVDIWDNMFKVSEHVKTIYINGGEPMLIKRHWEFLQKLVDDDRAKDIELQYSTNGTVDHPLAWELWPQFKKVTIMLSIDDLEDRNHYVRYPANWSDIMSFIDKLNEHEIYWFVLQTVSAMNLYYVAEMYEWAKEQGTFVAHNFVYDPPHLSINAIPEEKRLQIIEKLDNTLPKDVLKKFEQHSNIASIGNYEQFVQYTQLLDRMRDQSFAKVMSEYAEFLEWPNTKS